MSTSASPPTPPPAALDNASPQPFGLTDRERDVLDFAALRWHYDGAKETAIADRFGWTPTRYYQVLVALLERPDAAAYAPVLVARLRRLVDARRGQRSTDRIRIDG